MKLSMLIPFAAVICFATACGPAYYDDSAYYEDEYYEEEGYYEDEYGGYGQQGAINAQPVANNGQGGNGEIIMHTSVDPKTGKPSGYIPLPSNWKVTNKGWMGPGNTVVQAQKGGSYSQMQRQINSIDQIIQQDLLPWLQKGGYQVLNTASLPEIAQNDKLMFSKYWSAMPVQNHHDSKGIEYKDTRGYKGMVIVHFTLSRSQYGSFAHYYMHVLHAPAKQYESSKKHVIYALANMKQDPQAVAAHNQREQQKSNASWTAHNQKMRTNQQNFNNWQKSQQTLSEVSDIYHEGWKKRNAMNNAGHEKSINGIWERQNMNNPYGGGQTTVQQGYKYYYINQNGQYFGTNNANYNPNTDPNMNHTNWRRMQNPGNGY